MSNYEEKSVRLIRSDLGDQWRILVDLSRKLYLERYTNEDYLNFCSLFHRFDKTRKKRKLSWRDCYNLFSPAAEVIDKRQRYIALQVGALLERNGITEGSELKRVQGTVYQLITRWSDPLQDAVLAEIRLLVADRRPVRYNQVRRLAQRISITQNLPMSRTEEVS